MEATQQYLFADPAYSIVRASSGKRFANYLVDLLIFFALMFVLGMVLGLLNMTAVISYMDSNDSRIKILNRLLSLLLYGIYMGIMEGVFKGKSIGKFITGTKAVNADGTNISPGTAFLRGLSRAVPLYALSALGDTCYPWHDRWTNSCVIDERVK